jgi:hypothetical protein
MVQVRPLQRSISGGTPALGHNATPRSALCAQRDTRARARRSSKGGGVGGGKRPGFSLGDPYGCFVRWVGYAYRRWQCAAQDGCERGRDEPERPELVRLRRCEYREYARTRARTRTRAHARTHTHARTRAHTGEGRGVDKHRRACARARTVAISARSMSRARFMRPARDASKKRACARASACVRTRGRACAHRACMRSRMCGVCVRT